MGGGSIAVKKLQLCNIIFTYSYIRNTKIDYILSSIYLETTINYPFGNRMREKILDIFIEYTENNSAYDEKSGKINEVNFFIEQIEHTIIFFYLFEK